MCQVVCVGWLLWQSAESVLLNLGREIEANVANILHFVLDHERDVGGEAERDVVGQRGRLGEEIEVAQCKGERDGLIELNRDCLIVIYSTFALAASDVASAQFTLRKREPIVVRMSVVPYRNRKLDTFFGHSNRDSVAQHGQITANALKGKRVNRVQHAASDALEARHLAY